MKKSLSLLFLLCTLTSFAQVEWIKSYDVARAKALSENKFIVMDFWAIWCGPCRLALPKLQSIHDWANENNLPVKVFKLLEPGNVKRVVCGETIGTIVG